MDKLIAILKFFQYLLEKNTNNRVKLEKWQDKKIKKFIRKTIKKSKLS